MFVPIDALKPILADLVKTGRRAGPARPWLGVAADEVQGRLVVSRVSPDGPADAAGIEAGDIILAVGGEGVRTQAEFYRKVWGRGAAGSRDSAARAAGRRRQGTAACTRSTASTTSARRRCTDGSAGWRGGIGAGRTRGSTVEPAATPVECALSRAAFARQRAAPRRRRPPDAPLRRHDLRQRLPAVPRPAGDGEADPAVVRRLGGRLDDLPRLLPDRAARGLRLLRPRRAPADAARAGAAAHRRCCSSRSSCCRSSRRRTGSPPAPRTRRG